MRRYSATEAIGPAWEHTRALLWQDRNWKRLFKLCFVAIGAELGSGFNFRSNFGSHGHSNPQAAAAFAFLLLIFGIIGLAIGLLLLYLGSRLQLAQFDIIVLRDPLVAPAWRRHGQHTWRWIGLKVVIFLGVLLLFSPLLVPAIPVFLAFVHAVTPTTDSTGTPHWNLHWQAMLLLVLEVMAFVFAVVFAIRFVTTLVLPGLAMEDLRFGDALRRGWQLFRTDPSGMLLFAVVQPLFLVLIGIVALFALLITGLVLALPFGVVGGLLWALLHKAGAAAWVVLGIYGFVAVLLVLVAWLAVYVLYLGIVLTFSRTWSLYFVGGRYPLLGQYLEPEAAVPVWTPPPSFPRDNGDSGPDFPADPALA